MWKSLVVAAGLALIGTSAWSQDYTRERDDRDREHWHEGRWDRDRDRDERGGRAMREGMRDRMMMMRDRMRDDDDGERSGRGAHFFLRSGDTQLRVVCGTEDTTRACVEAALMMFDRVQARASSGRSESSTPTPQSGRTGPEFQ